MGSPEWDAEQIVGYPGVTETAEKPYIPDFGDVDVDEMRALQGWHELQAEKAESMAKVHRQRARHLANAIEAKNEV
jgi:hypothetical protein